MKKVTKLLYVLLRAAVIAGCLAGLFYLFKNISYLLLHPQLFLGACPDCTLPSVYITFTLYALLIVTGLFVGVFPPRRRGFFLLAVFGLLLGVF